MNASRNLDPAPVGIRPADIYFVLFRHKWKILSLTCLGLIAAGYFYFTKQPLFQSDAEIYIRYVSDNRPVNPLDNNARVTSTVDLGSVMNSEMQIISSRDTAAQAATNVGPERVLAKLGGGNNAVVAASVIAGNLKVMAKPESSVIFITFRHPDPDIVQPVLNEIITDYQDKHVQIHKAIGMSDDSLSDEASKLRMEINQTEDELRIAKTNAGVISIADAEKSNQDELSRIRREMYLVRASLAGQLVSAAQTRSPATNASANVPVTELSRYKSICARLTYLEHRQNDYIQEGFTDENRLVKEIREQAAAASQSKADLERKYPSLAELDPATGAQSETPLVPTDTGESIPVAALPLRLKELQAQFDEIQGEAAKLDAAEEKISDLEHKKDIQEGNYRYFMSVLDQDRIDEALGPGRGSNIQVIQQPSPPYKDFGKFYKTLGLIAMSGLLAGLGWAFFIEFYFDRSVKRPVDLQNKLRIPFFLSIPDLNHNGQRRLAAAGRRQLALNGEAAPAAGGGALVVASPTVNHALHSHYDALRDRLVNYFESINLTRKPKLVAVTSTRKGAGVSTISAGLAASLSETGDGRVLLVDMNLENGAAQQFVNGKPGCQLDDALLSDKRDNALVQENLYVVSEGSNADKLPRILPKRFASLVPKLKASDYDYIIFDMPPVSQTSVTTRLAGFMDTVMLVVESEKTDRDVVAQAHQLLVQSKANVTAVLNKTRNYIPSRLQHDINADT
jgi:uncharacterized protein involved in exopolysaccharide biosynthesis/Mrp family chromosome partitioning ATPase